MSEADRWIRLLEDFAAHLEEEKRRRDSWIFEWTVPDNRPGLTAEQPAATIPPLAI